MNLSQALLGALREHGAREMFGIPGDFVLAFETDHPQDFLDLVMEMRGSKARPYTLRDTPIFTCVAKPFDEILNEIGC